MNNTQQLIEEAVKRFEKYKQIRVGNHETPHEEFVAEDYLELENFIRQELATIASKSAEMEQKQTLMKAKFATFGVITKLGFHGILRDKHLYPLNTEINNALDGLSQKESQ